MGWWEEHVGEVLGSWGRKSVAVLALAVRAREQPAWASELVWGGPLALQGGGGGGRGLEEVAGTVGGVGGGL